MSSSIPLNTSSGGSHLPTASSPSSSSSSAMADSSKAERKAAKKLKKEKKEANGHSATNGVDKKRKHAAEVPSTPSSAASSDLSDSESSAVHAHNGHAQNGGAAKKAKLANGTASTSKLPAGVIDDGLSAIEKGDTAALGPPLSEFRIPEETQQRLISKGIKVLFPIQVSTFDHIYDGEDVMGRARTGTGKTLAFALPVCCKLQENDLNATAASKPQYGRAPRVLCLAPTRELAKQIEGEFLMITPSLKICTVYGGTPYGPQQSDLRKGVDVVVGTCGRVKDLLEKGSLKLESVRHVILDEADEMLRQGFAEDVELILSSIAQQDKQHVQTLLFSATIPSWVQNVAKKYLKPERQYIDLVGNANHQANSDITHYAVSCHWAERNAVLRNVIDVYGASGSKTKTIIFCERKTECNEMAMSSSVAGDCQVIHGDITQSQRESTLKGFRNGTFNILVATDVAARGIDISGVELVIQCEPPKEVETYVHRSGRTGRAGQKGSSLVFYGSKHLFYLNQIERVAKIKFNRVGIPQGTEVVASAAKLALRGAISVHPTVIPHFLPYARQLIEHMEEHNKSTEEIVAACLAKCCGQTDPIKQRSLLSSQEGQTCVYLSYGTNPIRSMTFVWTMIRKYLFEDADTKVKGLKMTKDRCGAVFDIPSDSEEAVLNADTGSSGITFTIPETLPELDAPAEAPMRGGYGGGGGFRGGRGGGGGGFRGGRGGGGGRGGRGGFRR